MWAKSTNLLFGMYNHSKTCQVLPIFSINPSAVSLAVLQQQHTGLLICGVLRFDDAYFKSMTTERLWCQTSSHTYYLKVQLHGKLTKVFRIKFRAEVTIQLASKKNYWSYKWSDKKTLALTEQATKTQRISAPVQVFQPTQIWQKKVCLWSRQLLPSQCNLKKIIRHALG